MVNGRRIWLTGASSGIGAHMAQELLEKGARLALTARNLQPLSALSERYPGQVLLVPGDLTDSAQVRDIGMSIAQTWGALDTVILNAGTCEYIDADHFDGGLIERVVRTNLLAPGIASRLHSLCCAPVRARTWWVSSALSPIGHCPGPGLMARPRQGCAICWNRYGSILRTKVWTSPWSAPALLIRR